MLLLVFGIIGFAHLLWLGLYIASRTTRHDALRSASAALGVLAVALAIRTIEHGTSPSGYGRAAEVNVIMSFTVLVLGVIDVWADGREHFRRSWLELVPRLAPFPLAGLLLILVIAQDIRIGIAPMLALAAVYLAVGLALIARHARQQGESLIPDLVKSYDYSFLIAVVFGGQIVLAMWLSTGVTETMLVLHFGTLSAAIAMQVYLDRVQSFLDHIAFANVPWLREERAELRKVASTLPRVNMTDPLTIEEEEFARLTRRALGDFSDLTRLATSPLTNLPEVHRRLAERDIEPTTLERARELKLILAEAIEQLKPRTGEDYGTTDEWRFYNALYYPYIIGMRPYSRRAVHSFDEPSHWEVLEWFRTYVPERTLYNWQSAAAGLIAAHLREQELGAAASLPEAVVVGVGSSS
jgi:hypothetical protein